MFMSPIDVRASKVDCLRIDGVTDLRFHISGITVIADLMASGGPVTVTCGGGAWTYTWPPTGQASLLVFLSRLNADYLMGKLSMESGVAMSEVDSDLALADGLTKISNLLEEGVFTDRDAKGMQAELRSIAEDGSWLAADGGSNAETLTQIFGDDWVEALPERPSRAAARLEAICNGVIKGCRQEVARRRRAVAEAFSIESQRLKEARPPSEWMPGDVIEASAVFPQTGLTCGNHYTVVAVSMNRRGVTIMVDDDGRENVTTGADEFVWMYRPSRVVEL